MIFKISDNQYGRPHSSDSWASCLDSDYTTVWDRLQFIGVWLLQLSLTGVSALFLAADKNHFEVAQLLIRHGASPSAVHHVQPPALCCRAHRDPHPHLELEVTVRAVSF